MCVELSLICVCFIAKKITHPERMPNNIATCPNPEFGLSGMQFCADTVEKLKKMADVL